MIILNRISERLYGNPAPLEGPVPGQMFRVAHQRLARRILYGEHERAVRDLMLEEIGQTRYTDWGDPDMSRNVLRQTYTGLSKLYVERPLMRANGAQVPALWAAINAAGLWELLKRNERDTRALRENIVHCNYWSYNGQSGLTFELVPPDHVWAEPFPDRPDVAAKMWRARLRKAPKDRDEVWMYDYLDVSDPDRPVYQVLRQEGTDMQDVSRDYGVNGWPDEWRDAAGAPVLPYVWYHAERTGALWDAFENLGLVRGTLLIALYRTYLKHVMRTSSFRQRYAINAEVVGAQVEADGAERQHTIIPDPATILNFRTAEGDGLQAQVGAFPEPIRPSDLMEAIEKYERSVLSDAGLGAIDQQRTSGDPRSGYAIHVSMAALEAAQRDAWRQFARGDAELLRVAACIHNRTQGDTVPESGYEVVYRMSGQVQPVVEQGEAAAPAAPASSAAPADVQSTALNGAQVASALEIVGQVAARLLPRETGVAAIERFFSLTSEEAERIMGAVGITFFVETADPAPATSQQQRTEEAEDGGEM